MPEKSPLFNVDNLYIMFNTLIQIVSFLIAPLIVCSIVGATLSIAWAHCSPNEFEPLVRAGVVIQAVAFIYILVQEVWDIGPVSLREEIETSFAFGNLDDKPSAKAALQKYRAFAHWAVRMHKPIVRSFEAMLVLAGAAFSGFGDIIGRWVYG